MTLRHYDGRLFSKCLTGIQNDRYDVTPDMLATFLKEGIHAIPMGDRLRKIFRDDPGTIQRALFEAQVELTPIKPFREDQWSSYSSPDRASKKSKVEAIADDVIVIEGQFWSVIPEPRYELSYFHRDDDGPECVLATIGTPAAAERRGLDRTYSLNAWDRMVREADEKYGLVPDEDDRAAIYIDDAFTYDDVLERVANYTEEALNHDGDMLKSFAVQSMVLWAEFRDTYRRTKQNGFQEETLDEMMEAAKNYACCDNASERARNLIEKAANLLDARDISPADIVANSNAFMR